MQHQTHLSRTLCRRSAGLTLMELIVALAIVGLLALLLFGGLKYGSRVWNRTVARSQAMDDVLTAQRFLRGRLNLLDPFLPADNPALRHGPVEGTADAVAFSAPLPQSGDQHGLYRYRLYVGRNKGQESLWVAWRLDRNGAPAGASDADWQSERLVENIQSLTIDYFDTSSLGAPRWVPDWRERRTPPALVRIRVAFNAQDLRRWPALIVRPRLTASANCEFDAVSRRCRT